MAEIRPVTAADVRPLRHSILRPHQAISSLVYGGDAAATTFHAGAYLKDELVGIASVFEQAPEHNINHPAVWRVRGMAVVEQYRGKRLGRALLMSCMRHATAHGGRLLWCHARINALGFYSRMGFEQVGSAFDLPHIGAHLVMERQIRGRG